jgi:hypothetical protein
MKTIEIGINEKAALSSDKSFPFVYINFVFTLVSRKSGCIFTLDILAIIAILASNQGT